MPQNLGNYHTEARHVALEDLQPIRVAIAGHDGSPVLHELRHVAGLSTRSGTRIEDLFPRLGIQDVAGNCGARILNVTVALLESADRQRVQFDKVGISRQWPGHWIESEKFLVPDL